MVWKTTGLLSSVKKPNFFIAVLVSILVLPSNMDAQESDFGNWLIYIGSKKLSSK
jgi:hypothetical protein